MNEFLFLYRGGANNAGETDRQRSASAKPSPKEMEAMMQRYQTWFAKLGEEGKIKDMGAKLGGESKIVSSGGIITDGPYSEGKEVIGGYMIIRAADLNEAATIAKESPMMDSGGGSLEIRPIAPM